MTLRFKLLLISGLIICDPSTLTLFIRPKVSFPVFYFYAATTLSLNSLIQVSDFSPFVCR